MCPTACARSSCPPRVCPSHTSASTRCAACSTSMSAPPHCRTGSSGSYPLGPAPAACSDPSTKHRVLWLTRSFQVWGVPLAREPLGTKGKCFPVKGTWWEHAEMLWLGGSFCYKDANGVGVNGRSSGKRKVTSRAELVQGRAPGDMGLALRGSSHQLGIRHKAGDMVAWPW